MPRIVLGKNYPLDGHKTAKTKEIVEDTHGLQNAGNQHFQMSVSSSSQNNPGGSDYVFPSKPYGDKKEDYNGYPQQLLSAHFF